MSFRRLFSCGMVLLLGGFQVLFPAIPDRYCVSYGSPTASVEVREYFSFSCSGCLEQVTKDFPMIKERYIDTGKIRWVFEPFPADLLTIQGMLCLELLDEDQKQVFLEVCLSEFHDVSPEVAAKMMQRAIQHFGRALPSLCDRNWVVAQSAVDIAYSATQYSPVRGLPAVSINGKFHDRSPTPSFIDAEYRRLLSGGKL